MNLLKKMTEWTRTNSRVVLVSLAVAAPLLGTSIAWFSRSVVREASRNEPPQTHFENLDRIVSGHLQWAAREDHAGLNAHVAPIEAFFEEARTGTKGFAEDVLGWESKWKLAQDYISGEKEHERFVEERFAARLFRADQLESLIESTVETYLEHLNDVDSQVLVRIQADLQGLPYEAVPPHVDRDGIERLLHQAIQEAVHSVQADFRGMVGREMVSYIGGEVLALAAAKLATSAGILGTGAGTGTVTLMGGLIVGVIVDYIVSWTYDALYDPVGEIRRRLDETLMELESLILRGDGSAPGLEDRLRDYASRRARARTQSIRAVILPQ